MPKSCGRGSLSGRAGIIQGEPVAQPLQLTKVRGFLREREELGRRVRVHGDTTFREKAVADDLRLLLQAVAAEGPPGLQLVGIAAEGMAHQRQIERAALLRLPDMGHLMDEKALPAEILL